MGGGVGGTPWDHGFGSGVKFEVDGVQSRRLLMSIRPYEKIR